MTIPMSKAVKYNKLRERVERLEDKLKAVKHFLNKVRDMDYIRVERLWVITSLEKILEGVDKKEEK